VTLRQGSQGSGQGGDQSAQPVITPAQRSAIDAARDDVLATRQKLRAVQYNLNRGIARLETELRLFDIVLVPAVLTLLAIGLGVVRRRRRARGSVGGPRAAGRPGSGVGESGARA